MTGFGFNPRSVRDAAGLVIGGESVALKITFALDGTGEMQRFWKRFDHRIKRRIVRKAVNAACRPVVKKVRALAPKKTGLFKRSITHIVRTYRRGGSIAGVIGQRGQRSKSTKSLDRAMGAAKSHPGRGGLSGQGKVVPLHLVNSPIKPHEIKAEPAEGEKLVFKAYGRMHWESTVDHQGHPGRRFMETAFAQTRRQALTAFEVKFQNEIVNEANKLSWTIAIGKDLSAIRTMSGG